MTKLFIYNEYISSEPEILYFKSIVQTRKYILDIINNNLEQQIYYVSGLKGNKISHLNKYKKFLINNNKLYYYGEYKQYSNKLPYLFKFIIN
jgi:hypothetical protein